MEENENVREAKEELDKLQQDKHTQYLAWLREKQILDSNSMKNEGIRIGLEKGRAKEKIETVKKMLKEKLDVSVIAKITELTEEEIEKIAHGDIH